MINLNAFYDAAYFDPLAAEQTKTAARLKRSSALNYTNYAEQGSGIGTGYWRRFSREEAAAARSANDPFRDIVDGDTIDPRILRDLCEGRCPTTHKVLIKRRSVVTGNHKERVAGYDLQVSLPKSASILWAFGSTKVRAKILAAQAAARDDLFRFILDKGLIVARRGAGGKTKVPVDEIVVAPYDHYENRDGDMHLHVHNLILSFARLADGTFAPVDNYLLKKYAGALSALYRASFVSHLSKTLSVAFRRAERNVEIDGVDRAHIELFSKRRRSIEAVAEDEGFSTAGNRQAAQHAANKTRKRKRKGAMAATLEKRWHDELRTFGSSTEELRTSILDAAKRANAAAAGRARRTEADIREAALTQIFQTETLLEEPQFLRRFAEELQLDGDLNWVMDAFAKAKVGDSLVTVGSPDHPLFTHVDIVRKEHAMLRTARASKGQWRHAATLKKGDIRKLYPALSDEQSAAVRHCLNGDIVTIVQGRAGSGKSFSQGAVAEILRAHGLKVTVVAPSWRAVDVARLDTRTEASSAPAIQGLVVQLRTGKRFLTSQDVIIVDEAGMVDLQSMSVLIEHACAVRAKVILTGDVNQLQPVAAGAPLVSLSRVLGDVEITKIRRQTVAWQREASQDFASGDMRRALAAYDRHGGIRYADSGEASLSAVVDRSVALHLERNGQRSGLSDLTGQLVITSRRKDVAALNASIRDRLVSAGLIEAQSVTVEAAPRGTRLGLAIEIAAGDRIIFGEKLKMEHTVYNGDFATIVDTFRDFDGSTSLMIRLDRKAEDGSAIVIHDRFEHFVGFRRKGEAAVPVFEHAYCVTTHASQGATVEHVTVANLHGMSREQMYVAMTRHRLSVEQINDASRIDGAELKEAITVMQGVPFERERRRERPAPTRATLLKKLIEEASRSDAAGSIAAYVADVEGWLEAADPVAELKRQAAPRSLREGVKDVLERASRRSPKRRKKLRPAWRFNKREEAALATFSSDDVAARLFEASRIDPQSDDGPWHVTTVGNRQTAFDIRRDGRDFRWRLRENVAAPALSPRGEGLVALVKVVLGLSARAATHHVRNLLLSASLNFMARRDAVRHANKMGGGEPSIEPAVTPIAAPGKGKAFAVAVGNSQPAAVLSPPDAIGNTAKPVPGAIRQEGLKVEIETYDAVSASTSPDRLSRFPSPADIDHGVATPPTRTTKSRANIEQEAIKFPVPPARHSAASKPVRLPVASDPPKPHSPPSAVSKKPSSRGRGFGKVMTGLKAMGGLMRDSAKQMVEDVSTIAAAGQRLMSSNDSAGKTIKSVDRRDRLPAEQSRVPPAARSPAPVTATPMSAQSGRSLVGQFIDKGIGSLLDPERSERPSSSSEAATRLMTAHLAKPAISPAARRTPNEPEVATSRTKAPQATAADPVVAVSYRSTPRRGRSIHQEDHPDRTEQVVVREREP